MVWGRSDGEEIEVSLGAEVGWRCQAGRVLLRMLREPGTGRPAPVARLLALLIVIALGGWSVVALFPVIHWMLGLL